MKRFIKIFCVTAFVFTTLFLVAGCQPTPPPAPTVESVIITPAAPFVEKSGNTTLQAEVVGTNTPPQGVTWEIRTTGIHTETTIGASTGLLTVHADETQTAIDVRATSVFDTSKYADVTVTIVNHGAAVTSVTIDAASIPASPVPRGSSVTFTATVTGENSPPQTVTWSIVTTGIDTNTKIETNGELFIAINETNTSLTIKATSTFDTTKSNEATIQLSAPVASITITGLDPTVQTVQVGFFNSLENMLNPSPVPHAHTTLTVSVSNKGNLTLGSSEAWTENITGSYLIGLTTSDGVNTKRYLYTNGQILNPLQIMGNPPTYTISANTIDFSFAISSFLELNPADFVPPNGKVITVTGFPPELNGQFYNVVVTDSMDMTGATLPIASSPGVVTNGTLSVVLKNPPPNNTEGWNGTGNYWVTLAIDKFDIYSYTNNNDLPGYDPSLWGDVESYKINFSNIFTDLQFSHFRKVEMLPQFVPGYVTIDGIAFTLGVLHFYDPSNHNSSEGINYVVYFENGANKSYIRTYGGDSPPFLDDITTQEFVIKLGVTIGGVYTQYLYTNGQEVTSEIIANPPPFPIPSKDFTIEFNQFRVPTLPSP